MPHTAAYPTRREIERKLSLRSATDDSLPVPPAQHAASTSPLPVTHFGSPSVGETYTTTGTGTATASAAGMSEVEDLEDIGEEEEIEDEFSEGEMMVHETGEGSDDGEGHRMGAVAAQKQAPTQQVPADVEPIDEDLRRRMEGERLVKSGYLMKKGERRKTWKKRWFVLRTEKLAYYKDEKVCPIRGGWVLTKADPSFRNTSSAGSSTCVTSTRFSPSN